jgi:UDP-N-acetyl-D-glucosamine/UDP-N-acetyl-D-galactosamine dehydrogenase
MNKEIIGIVGLGYVGLPLATVFAEKFKVIGFDVKADRVKELKRGKDHTGEVDPAMLKNRNVSFTTNPNELRQCTFIIVAVPTPTNEAKDPDLTPLEKSSKTVGGILKKGMMVVYESTVYPGVTEDFCLPILERESGLKLGQFGLGYSPERVNPGDRKHSVKGIIKVVSGHDRKALERCAAVYGSVIEAGIHKAPNIKTAEAAKVIENVQRDLNIALMNELSKIFARLGLHTQEVLDASSTKWNFHRYHPGLVGGHCIGVDPYYLTHRALELGYHPEVILAGRRINDGMGEYVGELTIRELNAAGVLPRKANVWVLGLTFKENVPDFRNTRAVDVIRYLKGLGAHIAVWEPMVSAAQIKKQFGVDTLTLDKAKDIDAVVLINAHDAFKSLSLKNLSRKMRTKVLIDVKNFFDRKEAKKLGFRYVSL